ncbi:MAG: hypothetical protein ILP12_00420 [Lachnospiraceae bacterium]|nr:hypothetical protein [Lachnospiraceae bacterium]
MQKTLKRIILIIIATLMAVNSIGTASPIRTQKELIIVTGNAMSEEDKESISEFC